MRKILAGVGFSLRKASGRHGITGGTPGGVSTGSTEAGLGGAVLCLTACGPKIPCRGNGCPPPHMEADKQMDSAEQALEERMEQELDAERAAIIAEARAAQAETAAATQSTR